MADSPDSSVTALPLMKPVPSLPLDPTTKTSNRRIGLFNRLPTKRMAPTRTQTMTQPAPKGKRWRLGRRASDENVPKEKAKGKGKGTIIHAVPMSKELPPLPSPYQSNERLPLPSSSPDGIVARGAPSPQPSFTSFYHSGSNQSSSSLSRGTPSPRRMAKSKDRKTEEVIGVYKDGRVKWSSEPDITLVAQPKDAFEQQSRPTTSATVLPQTTMSDKRNSRPKIQVVIPNNQRRQQFASMPFVIQGSQVNSATAELVNQSESGRSVSPPSGTYRMNVRTSVVSPLASRSVPRKTIVQSSRVLLNKEPTKKPSMDSSESSNDGSEDDASVYSARSSRTSFASDGKPAVLRPVSPTTIPISLHSRSASTAFSIDTPVGAGVFDMDEATNVSTDSVTGKTPAPKPLSISSQSAHSRPSSQKRTPSMKSFRHGPGNARRNSSKRRSINARLNLYGAVLEHESQRGPSPTLSEAEQELQEHLTLISEDTAFEEEQADASTRVAVVQHDALGSVKLPSPESPPPSLPKRSSKRLTFAPPNDPRHHADTATASPRRATICSRRSTPSNERNVQFERPRSTSSRSKGLRLSIPSDTTPMVQTTDHLVDASDINEANAQQLQRDISAEQAEAVILKILESVGSIDDVVAMAQLNKGFYGVFKDHELRIIRSVLKNMSAPAWELRQMCPPVPVNTYLDSAAPLPDYTPKTYLQSYTNDNRVISAIKLLILERCQSFLRPCMVKTLQSQDQNGSSRADDALWRLWTFCKIFGSGKGHEEDLVAQMDWLRGGVVFHQKYCRATIMTTTSVDFGSILASAPEGFAQGNDGGLSAEQLFDMTELWTALSVLLRGILGRIKEARKAGVYENTDVREGDVTGGEVMLEEWQCYLLSLGLDAILNLATSDEATIFDTASDNGWTKWTAPENGGSRSTFIKEALARMYEEKIATLLPSTRQEIKEQEKEAQRQRIANLQVEIRQRKLTGDARQVTMSMERPMSEWDSIVDQLETQSPASMDSPTLGRMPPVPAIPEHIADSYRPRAHHQHSRSQPTIQQHPAFMGSNSSASSTITTATSSSSSSFRPPYTAPIPPAAHFSRPLAHRPLTHAYSTIGPKEVSNQHPLQREIMRSDLAENTADKAIFRIVEMGFTAEQARHALMVTDMGDGLRIDRAVELLLRQRM